MKKRLIGTLLLGALTFASTSVFVSCSDYDDDISNLQAQIDQLSKNLAQIETAITAGSTITSVEKLTDGTGGIKITLSDGSSYEISNGAKGEKGDKGDQGEQGIQGEKGDKGETGATGAQGEKGDKGDTGATGAAGKDAVVWTIGDDGYWYQDGVKTEYRAIGEKGEQGEKGDKGDQGEQGEKGDKGDKGDQGDQGVQGPQGPAGADGKDGKDGQNGADGKPGQNGAAGANGTIWTMGEDGYWYADGEKTENRWQAGDSNALTAYVKDGKLHIVNLLMEDGSYTTADEPYILAMNNAVRSLVFAGDKKASEDAEIERSYVDGVPAICVKSVTYKALTLDKKNTKEEKATEATTVTPITPDVYAYYHVNPANANIDDLKTNLEYVVKADAQYIKTRGKSEGFDAKVAFEDFDSENGILTVKVTVEGQPATEDYISTIALQTETDNGVVTSDYTAVYAAKYEYVRLANPKEKEEYHYRRATEGISNLDGEAAAKVKDFAVWTETNDEKEADFVINLNKDEEKTLNLDEVVEVHVKVNAKAEGKCTPESIALFGEVTYELVDYDKALEYAEIVDGVLQVKEGKELIAKNRTPVVRVTLKDGDKNVQIAYVKVKIIAKAELTLTMDDYAYECELPGEKQANNSVAATGKKVNIKSDIYDKLGLTAAQFNARYTVFEDLEADKEDAIGTVGFAAGVITWTISSDELWENAGKEVTHKIQIGNANDEDDVIVITLKAQIADIMKSVNVKKAQYIDNFWTANKENANFNCQVPQTTSDSNPDNCVYINDLNAPFFTVNEGDNKGLIELLDAEENVIDNIESIKFTFHKQNVRSITVGKITYKITVSEDGQTLYANGEEIATITNNVEDGEPVGSHNVGGRNYVKLNKDSEAAKDLLNTNEFQVYIQAVGLVCSSENREVKITFDGKEYYTAQYIMPIKLADAPSKTFVDGVDFGAKGSYIDIVDVVEPTDWRDNGDVFDSSFKTHPNYWSFYGIKNEFGVGEFDVQVLDEDLAEAEMELNGKMVPVPSTVKLGYFNSADAASQLHVYGTKFGVITYVNSGLQLQKDSYIEVNVTVTYGWGTLKHKVKITVKSTIVDGDFQ